MEEELIHEKIFKDIREKANADDSFEIEIDSEIQKHRVMMVNYSRGIR